MYSEILSVSIIYEFKLDNQETFVFFIIQKYMIK